MIEGIKAAAVIAGGTMALNAIYIEAPRKMTEYLVGINAEPGHSVGMIALYMAVYLAVTGSYLYGQMKLAKFSIHQLHTALLTGNVKVVRTLAFLLPVANAMQMGFGPVARSALYGGNREVVQIVARWGYRQPVPFFAAAAAAA